MAHTLAFINPRLSTQNVGDLFIEDSVKRILCYDRLNSVDIDPRLPITNVDIARINATDAAIIVGTNLWYRDLPRPGRWQFTLEDLRKIRVPIIPMGIGTTRHEGEDNGFEPETLAQIRYIHQRCTEGSARDGRTVEALQAAGVRNVRMTACPTLFRTLLPSWRLNGKAGRQVVVTVRKRQKQNARELIGLLRSAGREPIIAAQQSKDRDVRYRRPWLRRKTPLLYEYDVWPYRRIVEQSVGAIGWRLHGNMLHLAHGNRAMFLANCSRAESFCRSLALPYVYCPDRRRLSPAQIEAAVETFFDAGSYSAFPARYAEYYQAMADFLEANGLRHNLAPQAATGQHRAAA